MSVNDFKKTFQKAWRFGKKVVTLGITKHQKNMCSKKHPKLKMIKCIKCNGQMPELRLLKFGYRSCVNCSTIEKMGCAPIANHKTGNEIQIVPMELANRLNKLASRKGYGVCQGMKHN